MKNIQIASLATLSLCLCDAFAAEDVRAFERMVLASDARPPELRMENLAAYSTNLLDFALNNGLAMTRGGRIWASWISGGDGPHSFTAANWSDDGGKTWTDVRLVIDGHDGTREGRTNIIGTFWLDPDGCLRCYTDQSLLHFDGRAGIWESVCANPDAEKPTWSAPRRIGNGHVMNKPIVLSNGDWAMPAYLNGTWRAPQSSVRGAFASLDAERGATCFVSSDRGKTWQKRATVLFPADDRKVEDWQESQLVELKNGTLRFFARVVDGNLGCMMAADSKDGGKTFGAPFRLGSMDNPNARFQVQRLASGRLVFVKHGTPDSCAPAWHGRRQLTAYVSDDDGRSWRGGLVLDWDFGSYPDLFQAPDGTIYVTHDHGRGTMAEIWIHRFTEEDVLARRIVSKDGFLGGLVMRAMNSAYNRKKPERTHAFRIPSKMEMLRPGEVRPEGWLRDRCLVARQGYISRMDEVDQAFPRAWNSDFHPRGKYLDWGDRNKGAWCAEGGAYWFEGLVRLAWELDDAKLKAYATKRLTPLLERMHENAIGFVYWMDRRDAAQFDELERANHGFIIGASGRTTRALLAYYEATGDARALRALTWCLDDPRGYFFGNPVTLPAGGCDTWRYSGDAKLAAAIENFHAKYPAIAESYWPAMRYGRDVAGQTMHGRERIDSDPNANWEWRLQHGVLGHESLYSFLKLAQWSGDAKLLAAVRGWADFFEAKTRQVHGVTVADEQFGWPGPDRGTETCTVAGDILLFATLAAVTGEGHPADHVERSYFNAGAACVSRDGMHHVYFQSPNRTKAEGKFHAGPAASGGVYKRKHWPLCCTAALTRILPCFVQNLWMKPADGGLAAVLYAPNTLRTTLGGTDVTVETRTDYPFGETLAFTVKPAKDMAFPLRLRIPAWCANPALKVNGESVAVVAKGGYATLARTWHAGDRVVLNLPMKPAVERMTDGNQGGKPYCAVTLGPLLMAKAIASVDENTPKAGEKTEWTADPATLLDGAQVTRTAMPAVWDWPEDAPVKVSVKAADGERLTLVPYACARLRVALFPEERK